MLAGTRAPSAQHRIECGGHPWRRSSAQARRGGRTALLIAKQSLRPSQALAGFKLREMRGRPESTEAM